MRSPRAWAHGRGPSRVRTARYAVYALILIMVLLWLWVIYSMLPRSIMRQPGSTPTAAPVAATVDVQAEHDFASLAATEDVATTDARCAVDHLTGTKVLLPLAASAERFLVYSPQFGLSNQLVALRNAAAWALMLNRTLVLPHMLHHSTGSPLAEHGQMFDVDAAHARSAPLRLREMSAFLRGRGIAPPARLVALDTKTKVACARALPALARAEAPERRAAPGSSR